MQGVPLAFDPERYRNWLQNRPDFLTIARGTPPKDKKELLYKIALSLFDPATATISQQTERPSIYPKSCQKRRETPTQALLL